MMKDFYKKTIVKNRSSKIYVVSAPSGAGKTSLLKELVKNYTSLHLSISYTTRKPRSGEVHGKDYYFVSNKYFNKMIDKNYFLEYATVFNNLYGTSVVYMNESLEKNLSIILELDWQGNRSIIKKYPNDCVSIFILPPSLNDLYTRLNNRATDDINIINNRLSKAKEEISYIDEYDYVITNVDFSKTLEDLKTIINVQSFINKKIRKTHSLLIE